MEFKEIENRNTRKHIQTEYEVEKENSKIRYTLVHPISFPKYPKHRNYHKYS